MAIKKKNTQILRPLGPKTAVMYLQNMYGIAGENKKKKNLNLKKKSQ